MSKRVMRAAAFSLFFAMFVVGVAFANWQLELRKGGIYSDGSGGSFEITGPLEVPTVTATTATLTALVLNSNRFIGMAVGTIANGTSSTAVTLTGARAGDKVFATMNTWNSTYKSLQAIPGTNVVTLKTEANVGTTSTVSIMVVR